MLETADARPGPMPFLLLLDHAMRLARRHFRAIFPSVGIPIAFAATAISVAQALWFSRIKETLGTLRTPLFNPDVIVLTLLYLALVVIGYNAMQVAAVDVLNGRPVEMKRAWRFTLRGRVLGTLFLWYLATFLSLLLCCVPVLYVAPLLAFVPAAMADEGRFGMQAMARSAELARHNPARSFLDNPLVKALAVTFVGVLLYYLLGILVSLPFQIPMWVDMARNLAAGNQDIGERMPFWLWLQVPAQFLNTLVGTGVYLYVCFAVALLFFDTRGRKEGSDLRSDIDAMFPPSPPVAPLPGEPQP